MCKERIVFMWTGALVLIGLALGFWVSPWWLLLSAFIGTNLLQASLTGFCPLTRLLDRMKIPRCTTDRSGLYHLPPSTESPAGT